MAGMEVAVEVEVVMVEQVVAIQASFFKSLMENNKQLSIC